VRKAPDLVARLPMHPASRTWNALWYHRQSAVGIIFNEIPEGCVRTVYAFTAGIIISKIRRPDLTISTALLPILFLLAFLGICHVDAPRASGSLRFGGSSLQSW
jgi:hypothetical protein